MNRNLFVFSLLMVLLGIGVGLYFIAFLGLLLMIPSLLTPTRVPTSPGRSPAPSQTRQAPRRISPPPVPGQQPVQYSAQTTSEPMAASKYSMASPSPVSTPAPMASSAVAYSGALFPSPILPALSPMATAVPPPPEAVQKKQGERDELVEAGALLALLRLVFG